MLTSSGIDALDGTCINSEACQYLPVDSACRWQAMEYYGVCGGSLSGMTCDPLGYSTTRMLCCTVYWKGFFGSLFRSYAGWLALSFGDCLKYLAVQWLGLSVLFCVSQVTPLQRWALHTWTPFGDCLIRYIHSLSVYAFLGYLPHNMSLCDTSGATSSNI